MRYLRNLRRLVADFREQRAARRTYRELCETGRAPLVYVEIRLITDRGDDWDGMTVRGITGIKHTIPLTREGEQVIARDAQRIRETCISQVRAYQKPRP